MTEKNINTENQTALKDAASNSSRTFAATIKRRKATIFIVTILSVAAAIFYLAKAMPIYTSTARLYVEQVGPKIITEYKGVMTQSKNYLYTQGQLIKSTPIIAQVVQRADIKGLKTLQEQPETVLEKIKNKLGLNDSAYHLNEIDNLVVYMKEIVDVRVGVKDDIIAISCDSPDRQEAAQIVNAIIETYIDYQAGQKKSSVSEVLKILQKEKIARDKELENSFDEMLNFTKQYGVVSFDKSGSNAEFVMLKNLGDSLTQANLDTIKAKAELDAIVNMMNSTNDPRKVKQYAVSQPNTGAEYATDIEKQLRIELKELENEFENVSMQCSKDHPTVVALQKKIIGLQDKLEEQTVEFAKAYINVLEVNYKTAKQKEDQLFESYQLQKQAAQNLNVRATEYTILETKLEQSKRFCEILDDRIKELNVSEDTGALNISILEAARPAEFASSPQKAKIVMVSLILGLVFGIGLAMIKEMADWRLRSAEEISATLGVPVLGIVPSMKIKGKEKLPLGQKVHAEPKSPAAEAYRAIRTSVFFGVPKGQARTILVTSPAPGDGKTTMVSNLAIAMAQAGQKTLIIDADFRKPMQHKIFQFKNEVERGLSGVLGGHVDIEQAVRETATEGLSVLTSGMEVPNPSELLNSQAFENLLKDLTHRYDRVIIDSPPITSVADGQILAAICDITVLVLRADKSTRKAGEQSKDALLSVGANVLGAVVNDVSPKHNREGYYSHYGYYGYGYGYGKQSK